MGSSLETAIIFSLIITVICVLILFPLDTSGDAYKRYKSACEELEYYRDCEVNAQDFNYMLTNISENYRMIYGAAGDISHE